MKHFYQLFLLTMLFSMFGAKTYAHDIAVENADGVMIYYNYINDGKELEVTQGEYEGNIIIPKEVKISNKTLSVTAIGEGAFGECRHLGSVTIPDGVTKIGDGAFYSSSLSSLIIPNSVKNIGKYAFEGCCLTSVTIGNGVKVIGENAFHYIFSSYSVHITDLAAWCNIKFENYFSNPLCGYSSFHRNLYINDMEITNLIIPNNVTKIGDYAFFGCYGLTSVTIPNSVTSIGSYVFSGCRSLTSVTIPNSVTDIGESAFSGCKFSSLIIPNSVKNIGKYAFEGCSRLTTVTIGSNVTTIGEGAFCDCSSLKSVTIPNSVTDIGADAFSNIDFISVISLIENPFEIHYGTFSNNTINNSLLYVPVGTIDKYKSTKGWKDFLFIEEKNVEEPTIQQCEKPIISYKKGKLTFSSATDGAICQYSITDKDITSGSANEVQLGVTYSISVYATKAGYENSETATATLCWIDVDPKTKGITNGVASVNANAVLIQSNGNVLIISGAQEGSEIKVYNLAGQMVGSSKCVSEFTIVSTSLQTGEVGIVKIGDKSIKILIK
jgi:hypothetical protein